MGLHSVSYYLRLQELLASPGTPLSSLVHKSDVAHRTRRALSTMRGPRAVESHRTPPKKGTVPYKPKTQKSSPPKSKTPVETPDAAGLSDLLFSRRRRPCIAPWHAVGIFFQILPGFLILRSISNQSGVGRFYWRTPLKIQHRDPL